MSGVAAAIGGGAVIGAVASSNAANKQAGAASDANNVQTGMFNQTREDTLPYRTAGDTALNWIMGDPTLFNKFSMSDFHQDPGYQFQLDQGQQSMQRSAAAKGMLNSTGTMMDLNNYSQNMANTSYQQALNNFTDNQKQRYNMLSGVANMGMGANSQTLQSGMNAANNMGNNMMSGGAAQSAGMMAGANALTSGISGYNNYNQNQNLMNRLLPQQQQQQYPSTPNIPSVEQGYQMPTLGGGF